MTTNNNPGINTSGGVTENSEIGNIVSHTSDDAFIHEIKDVESKEEPSEITSGVTLEKTKNSTARIKQPDVLVAKFRSAEATALFDPEAMALLEILVEKPLFGFEELQEIIKTPVNWIKLAILIRAYFIEPLDNGIRFTTEGSVALQKVKDYLTILDSVNSENNSKKE